jgi:hypothetical protein
LEIVASVGKQLSFWKTGMPEVYELSDEELRKKLASGELSGKKPSPRTRFFAGEDESVFKNGSIGILG